jgi:hypothetical protein
MLIVAEGMLFVFRRVGTICGEENSSLLNKEGTPCLSGRYC